MAVYTNTVTRIGNHQVVVLFREHQAGTVAITGMRVLIGGYPTLAPGIPNWPPDSNYSPPERRSHGEADSVWWVVVGGRGDGYVERSPSSRLRPGTYVEVPSRGAQWIVTKGSQVEFRVWGDVGV